MTETPNIQNLVLHTTRITAAHVANNTVQPDELPVLLNAVHEQLARIAGSGPGPAPEPAVAINRSVTPDYIICLEDGRKLKMLKRHLNTAYGLSPAEYRERWGLAPDYPMVAPNYARQRSELAKKSGLGRKPA